MTGALVFALSAGAALKFGSDYRSSQPPSLTLKCDGNVSQNLGDLSAYQKVVIQMAHKPSKDDLKQLNALGVDIYRNLAATNSVAAKVRNDRMASLTELSSVSHVSSDVQ